MNKKIFRPRSTVPAVLSDKMIELLRRARDRHRNNINGGGEARSWLSLEQRKLVQRIWIKHAFSSGFELTPAGEEALTTEERARDNREMARLLGPELAGRLEGAVGMDLVHVVRVALDLALGDGLLEGFYR